MNRIEFLNKLEKTVNNIMEDELVEGAYTKDIDGKKCHCVLGHIYKIIGKEKLLYTMDKTDIGKVYSALDDKYRLEETGLTLLELTNLQSLNDSFSDRKDRILEYIDELKVIKTING
jgi:hypothetical protein